MSRLYEWKVPHIAGYKPKNKNVNANSVVLADIDPTLYTIDENSTEDSEAEN